MGSPEENIEVIYDGHGNYLIKLGDKAIELDVHEADQLLCDLASAMKDTYYRNQKEAELP